MKFTVERENLKKALDIASLAMKDGGPDPISGYYLIEIDSNGNGSVKANSQFLYCEAKLHVEVGEEGKMVVPGNKLKDIVNYVEKGPVYFETGEDDTITVTAGPTKLNLATLPADEFISPNESVEGSTHYTYDSAHLQEALQFMWCFIGRDRQKPQYQVTELRNGHWMASDGLKIGMFEREGFDGNVTIPTRVLKSVLAFLKASPTEGVLVQTGDQFCWVKDGANTLAFRRDDRTFSKEVEEMLRQAEHLDLIRINRDFLENIVNRMRIGLDDGNFRLDFSVVGEGEAQMKVKVTNSKGKESVESFEVNREEGEGDLQFSLDWRPLQELLKAGPFSDKQACLVDLYRYDKIVKFVREEEGFQAVGLIALRP